MRFETHVPKTSMAQAVAKASDCAAVTAFEAASMGFSLSMVSRFEDAVLVLDKTGLVHGPAHSSLHWVFDETFDQVRARNRADNTLENLALLRKLVLNMLRNARREISISLKRKRVGWSNQIAYEILGQMR